ncbi:MAG: porin family protein [Mangrovibacterium sp.]
MKTLVLFCIFLAASLLVSAQSPLNLGIKAGFNSSKITTDEGNFDENNITNFVAGAFARVNVKSFYLQPEAYFSSKGGKLEDITSKNSFDLKTIDVPLLLGYKIINKGLLNLRVNTGPVLSFVTSKDVDASTSVFESGKLKDSIFGWQYGAGLDLLFFSLDVRMENSFGDIYSGHSDEKSKIFMVTLGFFLL